MPLKHDNLHHISQHYALKSIHSDGNKHKNDTLSKGKVSEINKKIIHIFSSIYCYVISFVEYFIT